MNKKEDNEKEEKNKGNDVNDDEKEEVPWYVKEQNKTSGIIKKYNIGTLQMFISPEILSMTSKERKKIDKIYYKREYTITPNELQKSQKEYEKELTLQKEKKEQKEQKENELKQPVANMVAPPPDLPALPQPLPPPPAVAPAIQKKRTNVGRSIF